MTPDNKPAAPGLVEALRELVALKDLKDDIQRWVRDENTGHQWPQMQPYERRVAASEEYERRKPLAWAAARAALASHPVPSAPEPSEVKRGIELAARWVDARLEAFVREHGYVDPDTGTTEFGRGAARHRQRGIRGRTGGNRGRYPRPCLRRPCTGRSAGSRADASRLSNVRMHGAGLVVRQKRCELSFGSRITGAGHPCDSRTRRRDQSRYAGALSRRVATPDARGNPHGARRVACAARGPTVSTPAMLAAAAIGAAVVLTLVHVCLTLARTK